mgnify:CR=1 FL=1
MTFRLLIRRDGGNEHAIDFDRDLITVGRREDVDVLLPHEAVAGLHLLLERRGQELQVIDKGAPGGTKCNGMPLVAGEARTLGDGDELDIAGVFLVGIRIPAPAAMPATNPDGTAALARALVHEVLAALEHHSPAQMPRLEVVSDAARRSYDLPVTTGGLLIGRGEDCAIMLADGDLSREHAAIRRSFSATLVVDLDSKNGTKVNGERLRKGSERRLCHGDRIGIGQTVLQFVDPAEEYLGAVTLHVPREAIAEARAPEPPPIPAQRSRGDGAVVRRLLAGLLILAAAAALVSLLRAS